MTTDRADYILYAADTTALHRQHILLHEAAHLLCGHDRAGPPDCSAVRLLAPSLSPRSYGGCWAGPSTPNPRSGRPNYWPR
ncbi:hypothetical protein NKH77_25790 [Streptomyces sp. M19]